MGGGESAFIFGLCLLFGVSSALGVTLFATRRGLFEREGKEASPVSPRAIFIVLWLLLIWAGLGLALPFWLDYLAQIKKTEDWSVRLTIMGMVAAFPAVLLVMIGIGHRRGYLNWIVDLAWPDKENR